MTIEFHCPHCNKLLRTADDKAGAAAKCPDCGDRITVPAPETSEATGGEFEYEPPAGPDDESSESHIPPAALPAAADVKPCPMCGETIRAAATRCRYCGEDLGGRTGTASGAWRPTQIDASEVISTSWAIYKERFGMTFGGGALYLLLSTVISLPQTIVQMIAENARGDELAVLIGLWIFFYIVGIAAQTWLMAGTAVFLLKTARNENAQIGDLFSGGRYFLRALGNTIVFYIIFMAGLFACVVPGILLLLMLWPYMFVLVDSDARGLQALARSRDITAGNWGSGFVLVLVMFGLVLLGYIMCCVGVFATMPLAMLMFAVAYCRMIGQR